MYQFKFVKECVADFSRGVLNYRGGKTDFHYFNIPGVMKGGDFSLTCESHFKLFLTVCLYLMKLIARLKFDFKGEPICSPGLFTQDKSCVGFEKNYHL